MSRPTTVTVPRRFRGPQDSGNGGYVSGLAAGFVAGDAEVTLRAPPPLEVPLRVEPDPDGGVRILDDAGVLVAEGASVEPWDHDVPGAPSWGEATAATARYAGYRRHAFPECFVCGHHRPDGLRILAGPVSGRSIVASPWTPGDDLPASGGLLGAEMIWASLDCPGAWSVEREAKQRPVVLGRMAARVFRDVPVRQRYIAVGWPLGAEGRKLYSGTALFDDGGTLMATARQIWIVLA